MKYKKEDTQPTIDAIKETLDLAHDMMHSGDGEERQALIILAGVMGACNALQSMTIEEIGRKEK